jgi:hypothetical protein
MVDEVPGVIADLEHLDLGVDALLPEGMGGGARQPIGE